MAQVLDLFLVQGPSNAVITLLLDYCYAAAAFERFEQMRQACEDRGLKLAIFAACNADELAYGCSFCPLVCDSLTAKERADVLQSQSPCFVHTSRYPLKGGLFKIIKTGS